MASQALISYKIKRGKYSRQTVEIIEKNNESHRCTVHFVKSL